MEIWEEIAEVIAYHERNTGGRSAGGEPITPAHNEAWIFAESAAREIVLSATAGNQRAEFGHRRSADEGIKPSDNPDANEIPRIRQALADLPRRINNAGG